MKRKKYLLPLLTLALILSGAAMPFLVSNIQDIRIGRLGESLELNTVSLTLRQDADVEEVMKLIGEDYTSIPWTGETNLNEQDVLSAVVEVIEELNIYGLLSDEEAGWLLMGSALAQPCLLVVEDGSSALVWSCFWYYDTSTNTDSSAENSRKNAINSKNDTSDLEYGLGGLLCAVIVDDASGKAVSVEIHTLGEPYDSIEEAAYICLEKWTAFLHNYYNIRVNRIHNTIIKWSYNEDIYQFALDISFKEESWELNLMVGRNFSVLNC